MTLPNKFWRRCLGRKPITVFTHVIAIADVPNKNNRIYPKRVLENVVANFHSSQQLGQMGTLAEGKLRLSEVSHSVHNLRMVDDKLVADIRLLPTPRGRELAAILDCAIVFKLCGEGAIQISENGSQFVRSYRLKCINAFPGEKAS